jgi:cysteine desulfurase
MARFCFGGIEGEALVFMLNLQKIYANGGAACASQPCKAFPSLCGIRISPDGALRSMVFTTDLTKLKDEGDCALEELLAAVEKPSSFSPVSCKERAAVPGGGA